MTTYGRSLPKEIGKRDKWTYYKLFKRLNNRYNIDYLCTDEYEVYTSFNLAKVEHRRTKEETSIIECVNSRIRNYLARFNRRTKRYSKSIDMIYYSLLLLFDKLYWKLVIRW